MARFVGIISTKQIKYGGDVGSTTPPLLPLNCLKQICQQHCCCCCSCDGARVPPIPSAIMIFQEVGHLEAEASPTPLGSTTTANTKGQLGDGRCRLVVKNCMQKIIGETKVTVTSLNCVY